MGRRLTRGRARIRSDAMDGWPFGGAARQLPSARSCRDRNARASSPFMDKMASALGTSAERRTQPAGSAGVVNHPTKQGVISYFSAKTRMLQLSCGRRG